jgi:hypothetical protein
MVISPFLNLLFCLRVNQFLTTLQYSEHSFSIPEILCVAHADIDKDTWYSKLT